MFKCCSQMVLKSCSNAGRLFSDVTRKLFIDYTKRLFPDDIRRLCPYIWRLFTGHVKNKRLSLDDAKGYGRLFAGHVKNKRLSLDDARGYGRLFTGHVKNKRLSLDDARGRKKWCYKIQGYMTLEGCAHIFEGCSWVMLGDCPWMMLEAEKKNDVTKYKAISYDIRRLCPYIWRLFTDHVKRLSLDDARGRKNDVTKCKAIWH